MTVCSHEHYAREADLLVVHDFLEPQLKSSRLSPLSIRLVIQPATVFIFASLPFASDTSTIGSGVAPLMEMFIAVTPVERCSSCRCARGRAQTHRSCLVERSALPDCRPHPWSFKSTQGGIEGCVWVGWGAARIGGGRSAVYKGVQGALTAFNKDPSLFC